MFSGRHLCAPLDQASFSPDRYELSVCLMLINLYVPPETLSSSVDIYVTFWAFQSKLVPRQ